MISRPSSDLKKSYRRLRNLLVTGPLNSIALQIAADFRLASLLSETPRTCEDLARVVQARPDYLRIVLDALTAINVVRPDTFGVYSLTNHGYALHPDSHFTIHNLAAFWGSSFHWDALCRIKHTVRDGKSAYEHLLGRPFYEHATEHGEEAEIFSEGMAAFAGPEDDIIVRSYDFSGFAAIADLGAGSGTLLCEILERHPSVRGTMFDLPSVLRKASGIARVRQLFPRLTLVPGDIFSRIPANHDCYILKSVLMDWSDQQAREILRGIRTSLIHGGSLLICEHLYEPKHLSAERAAFGLEILTLGGQVRSREQMSILLYDAGLRANNILTLSDGLTLFVVSC
jgi:hypothetical protein